MNPQDTTMKKQIFIAILTEKDKNQATHLITDTFCELNPIWSHYVTNEQIHKQLYSYVSQFVDKSFETHLLYAGIDIHTRQIISVGVYLDMADYINILHQIKGKYDHINLINQLRVCGQQLEKDLRSKKHKYGDSVIVVLGAAKKNLNKNHFATFTFLSIQRDLFLRGFKYLYGRCTNELSKRIMMNYGGEVINTLTIKQNKLKMYLVQTDLDKLKQLKDQVLNYIWKHGSFIPPNL